MTLGHPATTRPRFAEPPSAPDVAVIGAGAAGIAAARRLVAAGLGVVVLEARDRVGGRAVTVSLRGHPVDLGAHWLHAGPINPLVALGQARGEPIRRAPVEGHLFVRGRRAAAAERAALDRAFGRADAAMTRAARSPQDRPAGAALGPLGRFGRHVARVHGLVSGRPLDEVSLHDFPSLEYADNRFVAGGLGAYLARLAQGLPVRLNTPVLGLDGSGRGVRVETAAGTLAVRAVVLTLPVAALQAGRPGIAPALPARLAEAVHAFVPGIYEHVVLHWPGHPFRGADRLAALVGTRHEPPGLLTAIDGTPFHFFELDQPAAARLDGRDAHAPARYARMALAEQFGARALAGLAVPAATAWRRDPWSRASWAVLPPGRAWARARLEEPVAERIWLAGEALSRAQWGTAGGAWEEGTRAADEIVAVLRRQGAARP